MAAIDNNQAGENRRTGREMLPCVGAGGTILKARGEKKWRAEKQARRELGKIAFGLFSLGNSSTLTIWVSMATIFGVKNDFSVTLLDIGVSYCRLMGGGSVKKCSETCRK